MPGQISGEVAPGFGPVADAFAANFDDPGEDAAALAVSHDGTSVVDLWGGVDVVHDRPMPADGLMMVASCSKGISATVLAMLVERGEVDPEEPVAACWPEFAAAGKADVTVAMVASHTAGLPYPPLGTGLQGLDPHRGPAVTAALAAAPPLWEPGKAMAYHPVTVGTLLDEIVRRTTGSSISQQLRRLVAEPLGLDMWIGLPEPMINRVVPGRWEGVSPMDPSDTAPAPGSYADLRQQFLREKPPMDPDFSDADRARLGLRGLWAPQNPKRHHTTDEADAPGQAAPCRRTPRSAPHDSQLACVPHDVPQAHEQATSPPRHLA